MSSRSAWSHNLRHCKYTSDSDSQSSTPSSTQEKAKEILSEDAKLLQALDLSSRQDEAVYKPNPWTIAKVNAATRAVPSVDTTYKNADAPGRKKQPQGRIVDGLKKQASRTTPQNTRKVLKPPPFRRTSHARTPQKQPHSTKDALAASINPIATTPSLVRSSAEPSHTVPNAAPCAVRSLEEPTSTFVSKFSDNSAASYAHTATIPDPSRTIGASEFQDLIATPEHVEGYNALGSGFFGGPPSLHTPHSPTLVPSEPSSAGWLFPSAVDLRADSAIETAVQNLPVSAEGAAYGDTCSRRHDTGI